MQIKYKGYKSAKIKTDGFKPFNTKLDSFSSYFDRKSGFQGIIAKIRGCKSFNEAVDTLKADKTVKQAVEREADSLTAFNNGNYEMGRENLFTALAHRFYKGMWAEEQFLELFPHLTTATDFEDQKMRIDAWIDKEKTVGIDIKLFKTSNSNLTSEAGDNKVFNRFGKEYRRIVIKTYYEEDNKVFLLCNQAFKEFKALYEELVENKTV